MKTKNLILAILLAAVFSGFGSVAFARGAANAPGKYEDWHDLHHVQIMQTFSLAN